MAEDQEEATVGAAHLLSGRDITTLLRPGGD